MKKDAAFSGLEAAIVLIAFVVVAAVFSYVMLGAGFFATQKSQEVTYAGIKQATSNLVLDGQIYGDASTITSLTFWLTIPEGGQAQSMSEVKILFTLNGGTVDDSISPTWDPSGLLQPGERVKGTYGPASANQPSPGDTFTMEIKPKVGASTLIAKTLSSGYNGGVII